MARCVAWNGLLLISSALLASRLYAFAGAEAASFLEIPVGAEAAALGSAYSALATDAYAPAYNPAGVGFVDSSQLAGQHLSYLESIHYEYLSFVQPLSRGKALAASAQYLGTGDIPQTADNGDKVADYSSHFAAYTLTYGQRVTEKISLGISSKLINARISDVSANAYAADAGAMIKATPKLNLAAVMSNAGTKLTFLNEGGSLPLNGRIGAAYAVTRELRLAADGVYQAYGQLSGRFGTEWRPSPFIALRAGYRTDTTKELGAMAGVTAGVGLSFWGQDFSYAWVPLGDLGDTQYFSLLLHFGNKGENTRNLIQYHHLKTHPLVYKITDPEYEQLMQLLSEEEKSTMARSTSAAELVESAQ